MVETASGLVLRTRRLTETSLIVHWLTPELGRLATVAKGALRPKSPFRGKLDLFYRAEFSFVRSRRSDLHTLREVTLRDPHAGLRQDLAWLQQASYCAAFIERTTESDTPIPAIYHLLKGLLDVLPVHPAHPQTLFAFELKMLRELGLQPDWEQTRLSPGGIQLAKWLANTDWPGLAQVKPSPAQARELSQFLHGFLIYHLEHIPKGREAALAWHERTSK